MEDESIEHVCRDCCFTRDLIKLFPKVKKVLRSVVQSMSFIDWLAMCLEIFSKEEFALLLMII